MADCSSPGAPAGSTGLGAGAAAPGPLGEVPELAAEVPALTAKVPEPDPAAPGAVGTKMESDSGEGLMDGLRRHSRETPYGIACRLEPMRVRASTASLYARGT